MIHHYSIPVTDPRGVAQIMADLVGGTVTRFGPYRDSFITWFGDEHGTAIEFYPVGTEMFPDAGAGQANFRHVPHSGFIATHAAISLPCERDDIHRVARAHGWRAVELPRGGFNVIEFWIENRVMIELLTPDMARDYLESTRMFRASAR